MSIQGYRQWQTARVITTEDTLLTDYKPADVTAAVFAKMISVHPATAIMLRVLGKDTDNDSAELVISGWMAKEEPKGVGPGHRLWRGKIQLGSKSWAGVPLDDGMWGASATWFEVDIWDDTTSAADYDMVEATVLGFDAVAPSSTRLSDPIANQESCLLLPTLGYSHLLLEIRDIGGAGEMTEIGLLWRPVDFERVRVVPGKAV